MAYQSRLELIVDSRSGERELKRFQGRLGEVDRAGDRASGSVDRVGSSAGRLRGIAVAASGALVGLTGAMSIGRVVGYADAWTNTGNQIRQVTTSSQQLAEVQQELVALAIDTRSNFESTANLYARLARSTVELGLSQEELIDLTGTINKSFAVSGATAQEASNAITQLSQGLASGALRGEEFNSVADQAPDILRAVADYLGITRGELRDFAATGGITAEVVVGALQKASDEIDGRFGGSIASFGQKMEVANTQILNWVGSSEAVNGAVGLLGDSVLGLTDNIDLLVDAGIGIAAIYSGRLLGSITAVTGAKLAATRQAILYQGALARMAGVSTAAAASQTALAGAMALLGGPVGAAAVAAGAIYYFREELGLVRSAAEPTTQRIDNLTDALNRNSVAAVEAGIVNLSAEYFTLGQRAAAATAEIERLTAAQENDRQGAQARLQNNMRLRDLREELAQVTTEQEAAGKAATQLRETLAGLGETTPPTTNSLTELGVSTDELTRAAKDAQQEADQFERTLQSLTDRLYPIEAAQRTYREEQAALTRAWNEGIITADRYTEAMLRLERAQLSTQTAAGAYGSGGGFGSEIGSRGGVGAPTDPLAGIGGNQDQDYWQKWLDSAETAFTDFDQLAANTAENFQRGFGNAFESMIFDSQSFGDAMYNLTDGIARSMVNALGQMAGQWLAYQAVQMATGRSMEAAAVAGAAATGSSIAAAYAPAAAAASLASFGANAAPAATGIASTFALTKTLSLSGMAHDGIDRVPREGTWLLDKGERVLSRPQTDRLDEYLRKQENGGRSGDVTITYAPVIQVEAQPGATEQDGQRFAQGLDAHIKTTFYQLVQKEQRPGGVFAKR